MTTIVEIALGNAVAAVVLAVAAYVGGRVCRSPKVAHALWLLVFVKLLTPPLVPLPVSWDDGASAGIEPAAFEPNPSTADAASAQKLDKAALVAELRLLEETPVDTPVAAGFGVAEWLVCVWLVGSIWWFGRATVL